MDVIGQNGNEGLHYEKMPLMPPELLPVDIEVPDTILQGNLVKDIPKEEKPTNSNSWGSPGGSR